MSNISHFITSNDLIEHNKNRDLKKASAFELLPNKVSWSCENVKIEIRDENKIIPLLLKCNNEVAVIKAPFDKNKNQAYIFDSAGNIKWKIREKIPYNISDAMFSDVYYINDTLYFFISINNIDYRFSFNSNTGLTGELLPSY